MARQFGIYGAVFLTNSASVCSMYWHIDHGQLTLLVKQETEPVLFPGLPSLGLSDLPSFLAQPSSNSAYLAVIMENFGCLDKNDWVFCNSSEEMEDKVIFLYFTHRALCLTTLLTMVCWFFLFVCLLWAPFSIVKNRCQGEKYFGNIDLYEHG